MAVSRAFSRVPMRRAACLSERAPLRLARSRSSQTGDFVIAVDGVKVRIELDGMFGFTSSVCFWPGFSTRAVDHDRPFLSPTGYRSFLGVYADPVPGMMPDEFTRKVVESYVARDLKGRLVAIEPRYRATAA